MKLVISFLGMLLLATPTLGGTAAVAPLPAYRMVIAAAESTMTDGEVRKVDPETKKVTIRHGELKNLDMPAMTMVFQVKDPAMLNQVKAGDKVKFRADKINGAFTVMEIEVIK